MGHVVNPSIRQFASLFKTHFERKPEFVSHHTPRTSCTSIPARHFGVWL